MAKYHVRYHVSYNGGSSEDFEEVISEEKYHWYCDGGYGNNRLREMAEKRDYKGRKVLSVNMNTLRIEY